MNNSSCEFSIKLIELISCFACFVFFFLFFVYQVLPIDNKYQCFVGLAAETDRYSIYLLVNDPVIAGAILDDGLH